MTVAITFSNLVYTCAAASRITGEDIVSIAYERLHDRYWCFPEGKNAIPVASVKFKEHFAEWRRQRSKGITDIKQVNDYTYRVKGKYTVSVFPDCLECDCKDWLKQDEAEIKKPTCKHAYAVLDHLGCSSLADFIQKQKAPSVPTTAKKEAPALFPIKEKSAKDDFTTSYEIVFQTTQLDEDGIPIDSVSKISHCYPTPKELSKLQTHALRRGYKLVSVSHFDQFPNVDEF
mgnify:FL=1